MYVSKLKITKPPFATFWTEVHNFLPAQRHSASWRPQVKTPGIVFSSDF